MYLREQRCFEDETCRLQQQIEVYRIPDVDDEMESGGMGVVDS